MHTIRLRGPWQLEPICRYVPLPHGGWGEATTDLPRPVTEKMPADWSRLLGDDFLGRVRYRRTFHKPTGLDSGERVWLVVEPPRSRATVSLDAALLGIVEASQPPARFDITDCLQPANRLEIVVDHPCVNRPVESIVASEAGGLVGEVRLEIEEAGARLS